MKIAIDASRYKHEEATGVEWYSHFIIKELLKVCKGKDAEMVLYLKKKVDLDSKQRLVEGKRLWTLWHLSRAIAKDKPDVLFVPSHTLPLRLARTNVITIHDTAFRHMRSLYSFFAYHYLNWSTKRAVRKADKIIVPSRTTAKDLQRFYNCPQEKIEVIYHGFEKEHVYKGAAEKAMKNSDAFKYFGIGPKMKFLLFVGRLESKKNLANLIEAFAHFREVHPDYFLILAGKRGLGFKEIIERVKKHGMMEHVILPGYVSEEEKTWLFENCEAFVFPSLYEGFGLPILESFHYKKPLLVSNVACMREIADDAAHYVDPYDVSDMAKGIEKIVNDKKYSGSLVEKGSERLKNFSWTKAAKQTFDVIYGQ